jgi:hypothetical protein
MDIHGYAIVSRDDCIADASGVLPRSLMNEADWTYFQAQLDQAAILVVGRASHVATPNRKGRQRLILSRAVKGLHEDREGWWWNPDLVAWPDVVTRLGLMQARIAVPGGQGAFDLFLRIGFGVFHLSRAPRVMLPGGRKLFSGLADQETVETRLLAHGLRPGATRLIDPHDEVSLTLFSPSTTP